jgi:GNAT superfamily N-acetyltransferase
MTITLATPADLSTILNIYAAARRFMKEAGNPNQWGDNDPAPAVVEEDLANERLYLCREGYTILGVFCYFEDIEPVYDALTGGKWLNDAPYGVIHRIAVSEEGRGKGVARFCFDYAFARCHNLKIDTHRDNLPMQKALAKAGFAYCGVVYYNKADGERLAYQKSE